MQHDRPDCLVIFDVDGTLVQSIGIDGRCFVQAVRDVLGLGDVRTDWETYRYQTDSGLVLEISGRAGAGITSEREIRDVREDMATTKPVKRPSKCYFFRDAWRVYLTLHNDRKNWAVSSSTWWDRP